MWSSKYLTFFQKTVSWPLVQCKSPEEFILSTPRSHNKSLLLLQDQALPFLDGQTLHAGVRVQGCFPPPQKFPPTLLGWPCFLQANETRPSLNFKGEFHTGKEMEGKKKTPFVPHCLVWQTDRQDCLDAHFPRKGWRGSRGSSAKPNPQNIHFH